VQLDFKKLQVFVAVAEQRNFSKAAEKCHLSQPTVSGHIKALEESLGVILFDRHTREVLPTKAGLLLYRYAKRLVRLAEDLEREIELFKTGGKGSLFLGGSTIPGQYILPALLGRFKRLYPQIEISLKIADTREIAHRVCDGELELGVVGAKLLEGELEFTPCFEDEIILILPQNMSFPQEIPLEILKDIPLIIRERGSGTWYSVKRELKRVGTPLDRLNIVAEFGSTEAVKQAVKAGLGGAFISKRAVKEELENGQIREVHVEGLSIKRSFYLITPERRTLSPAARIFIDFFGNYR